MADKPEERLQDAARNGRWMLQFHRDGIHGRIALPLARTMNRKPYCVMTRSKSGQPEKTCPFQLPGTRVDERDTMFARMARRPGTTAYEEYYSRHSELKRRDDRLRAMPSLCQPGGTGYDEEFARQTGEWFARIAEIELDFEQVTGWGSVLKAAGDKKRVLREVARHFGAVASGVAPLHEEFVYTHKGRFDEDYGRRISPDHEVALVFLVEMDFDEMQHAPEIRALRESARQYYRAAVVAKHMAAILREAGYEARAHFDAHYELILPPLAELAGLGEVGRNNVLIAGRYGARVRIGAVSTSAPLPPDRPTSLAVREFCAICKKCAANCPSRALSEQEPELVRGARKWPTHVERCYGYWRRTGSDCGICLACCPFSHPDNALHNAVRRLLPLHSWIRLLALRLDDLLYGREWVKHRDRSPISRWLTRL